jgi:hypothetical protein
LNLNAQARAWRDLPVAPGFRCAAAAAGAFILTVAVCEGHLFQILIRV